MSEPLQPPVPPPPPAPAGATDASRLPSRVEGLSCPSCGGALAVDDGVRVVTCPYCEQPLLALGEVGIRRFGVAPEVDAAAARREVERWLASGWNKEPRLEKEAEVQETFLCFLPFFRIEADARGVALGTEERRRTVGSGKNRRTETYEVDVERTVERHLDRTHPALNLAEWGVRKVNLAGDRLIPFDDEALERLGMVFVPTGSEREVREAALDAFRREADPTKGMKRVRFQWLETLRERLTVVYYPLWLVRYRFRERSYQALVDAEDGTLSYGKAPGNDFYRAAMLVLAEAAAAFVATSGLQWGFELGDDAILIGPLLGGALGLAIFIWGWKRFRHGGVVVEGSGTEPDGGFDLSPVRKVMGWRG